MASPEAAARQAAQHAEQTLEVLRSIDDRLSWIQDLMRFAILDEEGDRPIGPGTFPTGTPRARSGRFAPKAKTDDPTENH